MENIKVSVIIPAYNAEKYIERCLDSLVRQTLPEIEIIVVDDGSTDGTLSVCKGYCARDNRVHVYSKKNEGQGIARNFGIEKARGAFVGFVDADDFVELDMYERLYAAATLTKADWVYSYMDGEVMLDGSQFQRYEYGVCISSPEDKVRFRTMYFGGLPTDTDDSFLGMSVCKSIYNTQVILQNGVRFRSERIVNSEDLLLNLDVLDGCAIIATVDAAFYHYRHDNAVSFSVKLNPNRYTMFKVLYSELMNRASSDEERLRAQRRHLANVRVTMVEKARWCRWKNYFATRREMLKILRDEELSQLLAQYPIRKLPFMQSVYFCLMKLKQPTLLILFAKLRYALM